MSPAKVEVFLPNNLLIFLKPGQKYSYGTSEYISTEDGFYLEGFEIERDDGYTQSEPRKDFKYSDPRPFEERFDWRGRVLKITAISMSDLPK